MTDTANILLESEPLTYDQDQEQDKDQVIRELRAGLSKVRRAALSLEKSVLRLEEGTDQTKQSVEALISE